jgi:hypothetical protein
MRLGLIVFLGPAATGGAQAADGVAHTPSAIAVRARSLLRFRAPRD